MDIQEPDYLKAMKGPTRWEWFEKQKAIMAEAVTQQVSIEIKPEVIQGFLYMLQIEELKYCEAITMHHNAVVAMACAAIEEDIDSMNDWLLEALDQADCAEWQMYTSAQEFYQRNEMPWPMSIAEHRENVKASKITEKEDAEKFEVWYRENVEAKLK